MGRPRKGENLREKITLTLDPEVKSMGRALARRRGYDSLSDLVERLILAEESSDSDLEQILSEEDSRRSGTSSRKKPA
jgi:hypothetical protein